MKNYMKFNNKIFKCNLLYREYGYNRDINNNLLPLPKDNKFKWSSCDNFIKKITEIQNVIEQKKSRNQIMHDKYDCLLCNKKEISCKFFFVKNQLWDSSLVHYIKNHNVKPDDDFIDFIFNFNVDKYFKIKLFGRIINIENVEYIKIDKNQLLILDALMKHGGYTKKYYDNAQNNISRYSEHAGLLETNNNMVHDIIVSGNTIRVDKGDDEIFLPGDMPKALKYHYIFHTHPPTPKPGGRAIDGIIYEFPSVGDIFHFIEHYNKGKTIGSLVITPEGIYNIRKLNFVPKNVDGWEIMITSSDENKLYKEMKRVIWNVNKKAISEYGSDFTTKFFYTKIAQNTNYINIINNCLNNYDLHIDFFPRTKDFKNKWIVDTLYLPIY